MLFRDRRHAGRVLAERLRLWAGRNDVVVIALPRGGVPVAAEVADALHVPLDILVVRKLGFPGAEEVALGAIASGGGVVVNDDIAEGIDPAVVDDIIRREQVELERRELLYRGGRPALDVEGRIVILVDDGLATGASLRVAADAVRGLLPRRLIIAVPVGPKESVEALKDVADDVVCAAVPEPFVAVGRFYVDFTQTSDEEVQHLLAVRGMPATLRH